MKVHNPPVERQGGLSEPEVVTTPASTGAGIPRQRRWYTSLVPWWLATLAVAPIFIVTRIIFLLLTYFGVVLFNVPNYSLHALRLHTVVYAWYRWDAGHYTAIATHGYVRLPDAAFFPLYPALIHVLSIPLHHSALVNGMLISNAAFLGTLIVLYRLVETEFDRETAQRTALYLAIFPTALFFFAAYNESLFLLFLLLCFYALRRGSWWLAGLWGCLATLTRSLGLILAIVFLYEFVRQVFPQLRQAWQEQQAEWAKRVTQTLKLLAGLPAGLLIPLGLSIYAYYLNLRLHDPLAFSHAQVYWRLGLNPPWYAPVVAIKSMTTFSPYTFSTAHNIIDMTALVFSIVLLVLCFVGPERFSISQWSMPLFCLLALSYPLLFPGTSYNPLPSMERFALELFASFIVLAHFGRRPWVNQAYLMLALPMLAFFTLQFLTGHWTV
ncbi:MAG TPA: mannosyltransferase family protein [Ktedonobacteraceae bacterium]|nr:mannosyltransferase family protein [Ktedonobacteraceae bacterium]